MVKDVGGAVTSLAEGQEKVEQATKVEGCKVEDVCEDRNSLHSSEETNCSAVPCSVPPSSPCVSPVLAKHAVGAVSPPGFHHSSYQAGINQRFHAARHKFQATTEADSQPQATQISSSPKEEPSPVKQMARSTVTQVLSRFTTSQQSAPAKPAGANNSPFGTDYRSLAAPMSPIISRAAGVLPQGVRSPTMGRADRGHPPPIPPKKPGLAQAPASPAAVPRSGSHFTDSSLSGSCGLTSSQEGVKELDMVVSSN